jgi:endonuclease/exonuclease/phosphatase family metal-dependent hydrolase
MKKLHFCFAFLAAVFLLLPGCSFFETKDDALKSGETITLMTWNVHNLFDGIDNGFEYTEFLQSSGWSTEKYLGKVNTLAAAISSIQPLPDIILFQEVENLTAIKDLAQSINGGDYEWSHFAINPGSALGVGIISRLALLDSMTHSITIDNETTPRPVLEARVQTEHGDFVIFICHWKSKVGGADETQSVRKASARVILRRIRELLEEEPETGVIVAGDLNENHDEFFRRSATVIPALLPDDPYCALVTEKTGQRDFLVLSKNKPPIPVNFPQGTIVLFSPWFNELDKGSYFFRNNWETIDHFLLSEQFFRNAGWSYEKTERLDNPPFANQNGMPVPYNVRTGSGLSDHLPLLLTLKYKTGENN